MKVALMVTALAFSVPAFAISEVDYRQNFDSQVMPFYENAGVSGTIDGVGGVQIAYRKFEVPNEIGAVVFAPGFGEGYLKYAELEFDLTRAGYSVYVIDHRGQGFSERLLTDRQVGFVESFDHYVVDLKHFVDTVVGAHPHRYLLTNSMGGAIGALYLAQYPWDFEKATMSVPMLEVDTKQFPEPIAYAYASFEVFVGHGDRYAPGQKPYDFNKRFLCDTRSGRGLRYCAIDDGVASHPEVAEGGASFKWVLESLKATRRIRHGLGYQIQTPILLFQAGSDELVKPGGQNTFCDQSPRCQIMAFPGSSHEIITERDEIRDRALAAMLEFFR